jgi:DNA end-binding protein Ku
MVEVLPLETRHRGGPRPLAERCPRVIAGPVDAGTGEEVSRGDLVKGFEIVKNEYVLLDKEDFEKVKLESTRIIDIEKFVPADTIDRLYWDTPYHLVPSGKTGLEAFAVIR